MKHILAIATFLFMADSLPAGTLTPSLSPAPTMKTLDEVEPASPIHKADFPVTISKPGTYYFTENMEVPVAATAAITITTSNVTLDLRGFTLRRIGPTAGPFTCDAIGKQGTVNGITIQNGFITSWPGFAVYLESRNCLLDNVTASSNSAGFALQGGIISKCEAYDNGGSGFTLLQSMAPSAAVVTGCLAERNGAYGINVTTPAVISGNNCSSNGNAGIRANQHASLISRNQCTGNAGEGILVTNLAAGSTITENTCSNNTLPGIQVDAGGCRIDSNNCVSNISGIEIAAGSIAIRNTAKLNMVNFVFVDGSSYGPVLDVSGLGPITSTNPWANLSY